MELSADTMYHALLEKDSQFEGIFYVGVKTTGIFCRNTCTARKPKRENVVFFNNAQSAILEGFRPCKICKPLQAKGEVPDYIAELIQEINHNPDQKITDWNLRQRNIAPAAVRTWFKKEHGMTFQAFQRLTRINHAIGMIQKGEKVSSAAYDNGYESLSGFNYTIQKTTGLNPKATENKSVITATRFSTPLGTMMAATTDEGICLLEFTDRKALETELKQLQKLLNAIILPGDHPILQQLKQELDEYFAGTRKEFTVPLHAPGTNFQKQVWQALQTIPYAETRSYKQQALKIEQPQAIRAVARANGANRISVLIPCHRVIGEDGNLTGYGGGIWRKQWLLNHEKGFANI